MRIVLIAGLMFASACTTLSDQAGTAVADRKEIVGLIDMSYEYIEQEWGKPEYDLPKTDGRTVKFKGVTTEDTDPDTGASEKKICQVKLDVNQEGLVENWDYEDCVYADPNAVKSKIATEPDDEDIDLGQKPIEIDEDDMDPAWNELNADGELDTPD